jgi:hypothetical protein
VPDGFTKFLASESKTVLLASEQVGQSEQSKRHTSIKADRFILASSSGQ